MIGFGVPAGSVRFQIHIEDLSCFPPLFIKSNDCVECAEQGFEFLLRVALPAGTIKPPEVPCHPHRLLTSRCCDHSALLGLVDDVDCAVVEAKAPDASSPASLRHLTSIPALTYVAEGEDPGGWHALTLVALSKYNIESVYLLSGIAARLWKDMQSACA